MSRTLSSSLPSAKNTADADIAQRQKALDDVKADGTYDAITRKYM